MSRRHEGSAVAITLAVLALAARAGPTPMAAVASEVTVTSNVAAHRVDVSIGGHPFTSYIWPDTLKKPVLYPLRSASGTLVTRGWPFDPRPGERVDHPHHVGLWFDYGDVNGVDFWNNSDALKPEDQAKMGVIVHRKIVEARGGAESGMLVADLDWVGPGGVTFLHERARFGFSGGANGTRTIDRTATLTAADRRVVFNDNKEGLFGLRVARQLEHPSTTPDRFTDASGKATTVPALDNTGVTGSYTSSEGKTGDAVWGTRGRWTMLTGVIEQHPVTVAILDHPKNFGFPTHWHARGYGLFAANPIGQKALSEGKAPPLAITLEPGASVTFHYRVLIVDGRTTPDQIEREYKQFTAEPSSRRDF
jgi:methane monooxygenase PmoA-like